MSASWVVVNDVESHVRQVLALEADDIPPALIDAGDWVQCPEVVVSSLSVDEAMMAGHAADPVHQDRRERFVDALKQGLPIPPLIPPLIALGSERFLVDGYARLAALRHLGIQHAAVCVQR